MQLRLSHKITCFVLGFSVFSSVHAGLFEDDEARKAILDLRQRVEFIRAEVDQVRKSIADENVPVTKALLELQRQIEMLRSELAVMRGASEQTSKDLADLRKSEKDQFQLLSDRISKLEPIKVNLDGVDFIADPAEKRAYESALAIFKKGDFAASQNLFAGFIGRYPGSAYVTPALFWLGNAQYATRDYKEAIVNFRALIARSPDNIRAPEAVLSIANCQLELKDVKAAKKTLSDLIKAYPDTEAANAAKERLAAL